MNKIKLLYLISRLDLGGMEKQLLTLVSDLDRERFEIDIVYFQGPGFLKNEFEALGCRVKKFNVLGFWDLLIYPRLYIYIKKNKYNIIHTHSLKADLWGAVIGRLASVPLIIRTIHNEEQRFRNPMVRFLERWIITRIDDIIIVVSDGVKRYVMKMLGVPKEKIYKIYYGIGLSDIKIAPDKDIRKEFDIGDAPLIGSIGRLVPQKGHRYLIGAAIDIIKVFPKAKFLIIGSGVLENGLKRLSKKLGLDSSIIFTGFRDDIYSIIDKLDLVVIPSLWEGFGLVLLEAMAIGKPIIATAAGGMPEVVRHNQTGMLVPPRNSKALAKAIIYLLENKSIAQRMGEIGKSRVREHFRATNMVEETRKIYEGGINV